MEDYRNMERCSGEPCCIFAERICVDNEKEILKMEKDTKEKVTADEMMDVIRIPVGHPGVHADLLLYFGSIPPCAAVFVTSKSKSSNFAIFFSSVFFIIYL